MSVDTLILRARAKAEADMVDTCTIQHPTGNSTDLVTGDVSTTYDPVYDGVCKVTGADSPSGQDLAGAHIATLSPVLHVPITVTGVVEGDLVTITACRFDTELAGRAFRILGPHHKTAASARRFACVEVTS